MAGTFVIGEPKKRPGVYHRKENAGVNASNGAINGIGAGLIKANWGPLNKVIDFTPSMDVKKVFGSGNTEELISEMFTGGITSGKFVRIGTGGTAPIVELKDANNTASVTITGKYVGDRAFSVSIRDSLTSDGRECIIYEGTTEFFKVLFPANGAEGEGLVEKINSMSNDFTATLTAAGSGVLEIVTQKAFTIGTQPTVATAQYSAGLTALESSVFTVLCVDTEETAVHALVDAFINRTYASGSFPLACVAEKKSVELDSRMTNSAAFNNEKMHYCLNSAYDTSGNLYDGYKLAARIGGMIASIPSNQSITHDVISGFTTLAEPLTNSQIEKALTKGCIVLSENANGQIWIEQGINTLVKLSGDQDDGWKKIRRVKTRFELLQRITSTIDQLIGKVNNDTDGRAAIISAGQGVINRMVGEKKLLEGSQMIEDESNPAQGDSAWFTIAVDDIDSIEKAYFTFKFRFTPKA